MPAGGDRVKQTAEAEHIGPDYTGDNISAKKIAGYVWNPVGIDINGQTNGAWERQQSNASIILEQQDQTDVLEEIETYVAAIAAARGIAADIRVTVLSGTVTTVSTVTTVTTLSNISSIGGFSAAPMLQNTQNQTAILSNINNIV